MPPFQAHFLCIGCRHPAADRGDGSVTHSGQPCRLFWTTSEIRYRLLHESVERFADLRSLLRVEAEHAAAESPKKG